MSQNKPVTIYKEEQIAVINQLYKEDPKILSHPDLLDIINNVHVLKTNLSFEDSQEANTKDVA